MPENNKRLILQKDWDIPLRLNISEKAAIGHFAGRKKEVALLANEIIRKENGSILVCGHRGVGKTSLVYQAIKNFKEAQGVPEAVIVGINFPQLEIENKSKKGSENENENEDENEQKKVLVALIKRLYHTCNNNYINLDPNIKKEISEINEKATAKKYMHHKYDNQGNNTSKVLEKKSSFYIKVTSLVFLFLYVLAIVYTFFDFTQPYIAKIIPFYCFFQYLWRLPYFLKKSLYTQKKSLWKTRKKKNMNLIIR